MSQGGLSSNVDQYALLWPKSPMKFCPATGRLLCLSITGWSVPSSSSTRRRDVFRFKSFLTMCRTELCDIPVSRAISLGLLVRSQLTFLATNELFDRLNVFVCSRTARTTAAWSSVSWTSFVNFSNKIVQRSFLPLSLRKFTHHLKSIPTFFQSQTFYQTPVFCR